MSKKRLAEHWKSYREKVIPSEAGPIQIDECRKAFYAGAAAMLAAQFSICGPTMEPTVNELSEMAALRDEIDQFVEDVKAEAEAKPSRAGKGWADA